MPDLGPYAQRLLLVMTGPAPDATRFAGEPVDLSRVDDDELGTLLAVAWRPAGPLPEPGPAATTSGALRFAVRERSPRFSPAALLDLCTALADRAADGPMAAESGGRLAVSAILRCTGPLPGALAAPAAILARRAAQHSRPHVRLALAALAGPVLDAEVASAVRAELSADPLAALEVDVATGLDAARRAVLAEADRYAGVGGIAPLPDIVDRLAAIGEFAAFARTTLETAAARVDDIHEGRAAYEADKAFTVAESDVLWRVAQVALLRDEPWLGELLGRLLPRVVVAPTAAKTAPSQSAAVVLAQAVDAWPTPEAVAALREARRVVRHAGLAKKLDRLTRTAEKGLARRPAVALRLPAPGRPTRAQLGTVLRALEAGYALGACYPYQRWAAELARHPHLGEPVGRLIWEVEDTPGTWRPLATDDTADPGAAVRLWHPARATADERAKWRDDVVERRIKQPFRQAFREHYAVPADDGAATGMFAGHVVAIRPLLGLAGREGWRAEHLDGLLHRDLGPWRVTLEVGGALYPGAEGFGDVGQLHLQHHDDDRRRRPARFADAPPVVVSEALRGVDLLVSVAGFGLDDDPSLRRDERRARLLARLAERPLGETATVRKAALQRMLAGAVEDGTVSFGARHVHVGAYAVHLATARVTRDGEPVDVEPDPGAPAAAVPWLPYDEHLLERVARTVARLVAQR